MSAPIRLLVCGGRHFGYSARVHRSGTPAYINALRQDEADRTLLDDTLGGMLGDLVCIIHGAAAGADTLAGQWARKWCIPERPFKAIWHPNGRTGGIDRSAGPARNARMLIEGRPNLVVAFPGGSGTADMMRQARAAGVEVRGITRPTPGATP